MTKFLFILAFLGSIGAIVLGLQNRKTFLASRAEKDADNKIIKTELGELEGVIDSVVAVQTDRKRAEGERDEQKELLASAKRKLASRKSEAQALDAQMKKYQDEFSEYQAKLDRLPPGVSLDTLNEDMNRLKQTLAEKQADLASLEKEIEVMNDNYVRSSKQLDDKVEFQATRTKSFNVNSLVAKVTAVNRDWGFVIVDAGSEAGITADTSLLVARNSEPIGKLRIISLEPRTLVADIDFDTVDNGLPILPGDKVVLEKPNQ